MGEQIPGTIRRLPSPYGSTSADEQDQSTRIAVDPTFAPKLEMNRLLRVVVTVEQKPNVLWLPPGAVHDVSGRKFVLIQDGQIQREVDVKLGLVGDQRVEILEGLTEGQVVLGQ